MLKFNVIELFNRLCGFEYELLKYIHKQQGTKLALADYVAAANALNTDKDAVRRGYKRLVTAEILIADGENFKINEKVYKND